MQPQNESLNSVGSKIKTGSPSSWPLPSPWLGILSLALLACFSRPLYQLIRFSLQSDLYSHIVLIPAVSAYLIWLKRPEFRAGSTPDRRIAGAFLALGVLVFAGYRVAVAGSVPLAPDDSLARLTASFLLLFIGLCSWFVDRTTLRAIAFPLGLLVFMIPFPVVVRSALETFLQHGSADAAYAFFRLTGTTVFYDNLVFRLPGINLQVAPECSGIHSSLALFITSLIAGHFFLRTPWKCAVLTLAVIPLAILRNGFRIFTLGELCVHINPDMIDSYIHHHGGPIFFVLSLIPFFLLLRVLYRSDQRGKISPPPAS